MKFYQYINENVESISDEELTSFMLSKMEQYPFDKNKCSINQDAFVFITHPIEFHQGEIQQLIIRLQINRNATNKKKFNVELIENYYCVKRISDLYADQAIYNRYLLSFRNIKKIIENLSKQIPFDQEEFDSRNCLFADNSPRQTFSLCSLEKKIESIIYYPDILTKIPVKDRLDPEIQIALIKHNLKFLSIISKLSRETLEWMIENYPWQLTDQAFSKCVSNCDDLKEKWSKIGKARKQIGL